MTSSSSKTDLFVWHPEPTRRKYHLLSKLLPGVAILGAVVLALGGGSQSEQASSPRETPAEKATKIVASRSEAVPPASPKITILNAGGTDKVATDNIVSTAQEPAQHLSPSAKPLDRGVIVRKPTPHRPPSTYADLRRQMLKGE
jgi:hypothetical protein